VSRTFDDVRRLVAADRGLATLATTRDDGTVQVTLVNAGVLVHPVTGSDVVALVARGGTLKLANLRRRPHATVTWRAGWDWLSVEGPTELAGPDDPLPGLTSGGDPGDLPRLLRDVFTGAGGTHDDWPAYDRAMADERRAAVLVRPDRIYGNPAR
jgi:PPOX class probable F420-dependent enzyme